MSKILWFDTETTGLNPVKNDIIQIAGLVEIDGDIKEKFEFKCRPFYPANIESEALKVHGFTKEMLMNFPSPKEVYENLINIFSTYINKYDKTDKFIPAGHNVSFDIDFLKNFFIKNNDSFFGSFISYHKLDTLSLTIGLTHFGVLEKIENYKLATLANFFGIEIKAHDALSDISATREVFLKLKDRVI